MKPYPTEVFTVTTAEDERNYFTGEPVLLEGSGVHRTLHPGIYRVIDGQLCRVLPGANLRDLQAPTKQELSDKRRQRQ